MRIIKFAIISGIIFVVLVLVLFSLYGFSQGRDVSSGLAHLIEFPVGPVEDNPPLEDIRWHRVSWVADIENRSLNESSGLAASNLYENVLWSINDSGNAPEIFAIGMAGESLGSWEIDVPATVDWESLDAFILDGTSYLIIGDIGDNFRWRKSLSLLVVKEPTTLDPSDTKLPIVWHIEYSYPQGPRDSEAMAVDASAGHVYVLSKRHYPPELFRVPLQSAEPVVAEEVAVLRDLPRSTAAELEEGPQAAYRYFPTGMDLYENRLLVTTYKHAFLYQVTDMNKPPQRVKLPSLGQREAITFARQRSDIAFISKERSKGKGVADLFKIELSQPLSEQTPEAVSAGGP